MFLRLSACLMMALSSAVAATPEVDSSQLPSVPATPPEKALGTFKIKLGFRLELAAAEPLVLSPVAMSFDEEGRLYVVEMRDYSERRPERLGRIRLLEDTDGDGRFDKGTVFAGNLPWPTAVTCWAGGIFVGSTPDVLWMKDTNGDGVADEREVIFTGFAADYAPFATNKLNVQALMNSFQWTLDNRIHGATSFSGGKVTLVDSPFVQQWFKKSSSPVKAPGTPLNLRGRDFSFDPRTLEMRAESGGGQHGMSFDDRGRKFVCANANHIQMVMYEERYAERNPFFSLPKPLVDIAVDGGAAPVFRISPDEPWRVIRTQWRVAGLAPGPIEGGGRASGYFTGATGVTIYRGDAYGPEFVGDAFIGDAGGNLVHRKKLRPDGIGLRAERPADEQNVEFLASTDNWFRPVQFANAPDGCLYVIDMYREVIEHPWSLPESLKQHLDLNSGNDRGRIYRIVPENFKPRPLPRLNRASGKTLSALLSHPNGWHRDTASRLIYERQDAMAIPGLETQVLSRTQPPLDFRRDKHAIIHSFHALDGLGALKERHLLAALTNRDSGVRQHALLLSERFLENPSEALIAAIRKSMNAAPMVVAPVDYAALQQAFTLGQIRGPKKVEALSEFLRPRLGPVRVVSGQSAANSDQLPWLTRAVVSSLGDDAVELLQSFSYPLPDLRGGSQTTNRVLYSFPSWQYQGASGFLNDLSRLVGARNKSNEVAELIRAIMRMEASSAESALQGLDSGLRQSGSSLGSQWHQPELRSRLQYSLRSASKTDEDYQTRISSIRLLGLAPYTEVRSILLAVISSSSEWRDYRLTALNALANSGDRNFGPDIMAHWPQLNSALRSRCVELMLTRPERIAALLRAVEKGQVEARELDAAQATQLRTHRDHVIREQALKVLGRGSTGSRQEVVERFQPTLSLKGDAGKGRKAFQSRCATCHKLGGEGFVLGPDLVTVKNAGKEKLLTNILDPNREVAPNFTSYSVETKDGDSYVGIIASESAAGVTLRMAGGVEQVIAQGNIATMQSQGRSLMPEGLEEGLSQQDVADLLEFLMVP